MLTSANEPMTEPERTARLLALQANIHDGIVPEDYAPTDEDPYLALLDTNGEPDDAA